MQLFDFKPYQKELDDLVAKALPRPGDSASPTTIKGKISVDLPAELKELLANCQRNILLNNTEFSSLTLSHSLIKSRSNTWHAMESTKIGKGGFGSVFCAKYMITLCDDNVARLSLVDDAIKVQNLPTEKSEREATIAAVSKEVEGLRSQKVKVLSIVWDADVNFIYMVVENCGPNLSILLKKQKLSFFTRVKIALHICNEMFLLKQKGLVHRDLKPANICVKYKEVQGQPVIEVTFIDFGLAIPVPTENVSLMGTPHYMAPELFKGGRPSFASDIYSAAGIFIQLFGGKYAIADKALEYNDRDPFRAEIAAIPFNMRGLFEGFTFEEKISKKLLEDLRNLFLAMQHESPDERPPVQIISKFLLSIEARNHAYHQYLVIPGTLLRNLTRYASSLGFHLARPNSDLEKILVEHFVRIAQLIKEFYVSIQFTPCAFSVPQYRRELDQLEHAQLHEEKTSSKNSELSAASADDDSIFSRIVRKVRSLTKSEPAAAPDKFSEPQYQLQQQLDQLALQYSNPFAYIDREVFATINKSLINLKKMLLYLEKLQQAKSLYTSISADFPILQTSLNEPLRQFLAKRIEILNAAKDFFASKKADDGIATGQLDYSTPEQLEQILLDLKHCEADMAYLLNMDAMFAKYEELTQKITQELCRYVQDASPLQVYFAKQLSEINQLWEIFAMKIQYQLKQFDLTSDTKIDTADIIKWKTRFEEIANQLASILANILLIGQELAALADSYNALGIKTSALTMEALAQEIPITTTTDLNHIQQLAIEKQRSILRPLHQLFARGCFIDGAQPVAYVRTVVQSLKDYNEEVKQISDEVNQFKADTAALAQIYVTLGLDAKVTTWEEIITGAALIPKPAQLAAIYQPVFAEQQIFYARVAQLFSSQSTAAVASFNPVTELAELKLEVRYLKAKLTRFITSYQTLQQDIKAKFAGSNSSGIKEILTLMSQTQQQILLNLVSIQQISQEHVAPTLRNRLAESRHLGSGRHANIGRFYQEAAKLPVASDITASSDFYQLQSFIHSERSFTH